MKAQRQQRGGFGRGIVAFTLGATAGSILALLFAPASGEVTRRRIANKMRSARRVATTKREKASSQ